MLYSSRSLYQLCRLFRFRTIPRFAIRICFTLGLFSFLSRGFCRMRDEIEMCDSKSSSWALLMGLRLFKVASRIGTGGNMRISQAAKKLCGWEAMG
jgi:hypothetical protein